MVGCVVPGSFNWSASPPVKPTDHCLNGQSTGLDNRPLPQWSDHQPSQLTTASMASPPVKPTDHWSILLTISQAILTTGQCYWPLVITHIVTLTNYWRSIIFTVGWLQTQVCWSLTTGCVNWPWAYATGLQSYVQASCPVDINTSGQAYKHKTLMFGLYGRYQH